MGSRRGAAGGAPTPNDIATIWKKGFERLRDWRFWSSMVINFCVFSVVGHWCEWVYCMFNDHFFGIVDPNSGVWNHPSTPSSSTGWAW
ncbi:MAG: hypothetical protein ACI36Y_01250 [Coriobacteriales bacterium]